MAIVVYAPSLALAQVTGINMDLSIALTFLVGVHRILGKKGILHSEEGNFDTCSTVTVHQL